MQLRQRIPAVITADPRLQRLIGRDVTDSLDWNQVTDNARGGVLSADEAALVQCPVGLAGAAVRDFNEHFDRLDGKDQQIICEMMIAETTESMEAGQEFLEGMQR